MTDAADFLDAPVSADAFLQTGKRVTPKLAPFTIADARWQATHSPAGPIGQAYEDFQNEDYGQRVLGRREELLHLLSEIPAGAAKLLQTVRGNVNELEGRPRDFSVIPPALRVNLNLDSLVYEPRTKAGKALEKIPAIANRAIEQGTQQLAEKNYQATGSPLWAAMVGQLPHFLEMAAPFLGGKVHAPRINLDDVKAAMEGMRTGKGGEIVPVETPPAAPAPGLSAPEPVMPVTPEGAAITPEQVKAGMVQARQHPGFARQAEPVEPPPPKALPAPRQEPIQVNPAGEAGTAAQFQRRAQEMGLSPDVARAVHAHQLREAGQPAPKPAAPLPEPRPAPTAPPADLGAIFAKRTDDMTPGELRAGIRHDPTTHLLNRRALNEDEADIPAFAMVDLDGLKTINDTYGHAAGDKHLITAANALHAVAPGRVYRLGGDEFLIAGDSEQQVAQLAATARKQLTAETGSGFSFGVGKTPDAADKAMYTDKAERQRQGLRAPRPEGQPPAGGERRGHAREPGIQYFDKRLNNPEYRNGLESLAKDLTPGGNMGLIGGSFSRDFDPAAYDRTPRDKEAPVQRLPSTNPDWFQSLREDTGLSVKGVWKAVDKALAGKKLGSRQRHAVEVMLDVAGEHIDNIARSPTEDEIIQHFADAPTLEPEALPEPALADYNDYGPADTAEARSLLDLRALADRIDQDAAQAAREATTANQEARELWQIIQEHDNAVHESRPGEGERRRSEAPGRGSLAAEAAPADGARETQSPGEAQQARTDRVEDESAPYGPTTYPVGQVYDATGQPYTPESGKTQFSAYPLTRSEADQLIAAGFDGVIRWATRGPDTTGEQGWFLKQGFNPHGEHDAGIQNIVARATHRERVEFGGDVQAGGKVTGWFKVAEGGHIPTPRTPDGDKLFEPQGGYNVGEHQRDLFLRTRGEVQHGNENRHGPQNQDSGAASTAGNESGGLRLRPDATPALTRRGKYAIESLVRRFGGSVLADTLAREFEETGAAELVGKTVRPDDIDGLAAIAQVYRNPIFETLHYIFADKNGRIVGETAVSSRLPSSSMAFPSGVGDKWQAWLKEVTPPDATTLYLLHNHPSGNATPSGADERITSKIADHLESNAGLGFGGHVVLDHDHFGFIDNLGISETRPLHVTGPDPLRSESGRVLSSQPITGPGDVAAWARNWYDGTPDESIALVATNARNVAVSLMTVPEWALTRPRGGSLLVQLAKRNGAPRLFAVVSDAQAERYYTSLNRALKRHYLMDVAVVRDGGAVDTFARGYGAVGGDVEDVIARHQQHRTVVREEGARYSADEFDELARKAKVTPRDEFQRRFQSVNDAWHKWFPDVKSENNEFASHLIVRELARAGREEAAATPAYERERKLFAKLGEPAQLRFIDMMETGGVSNVPELARHYARLLAKWHQEERETGIAVEFLEHYFPHYFHNPKAVQAWIQKNFVKGAKAAFQKQRTFRTYREALDHGFKPRSTNPADLIQMRWLDHERIMTRHRTLQSLEQNGLLYREEQPGTRKMTTADFGAYYAPEGVANLLENSLFKTSLWTDKSLAGSLFRGIMEAKQLIIPIKLGFSAFHLLHVGIGVKSAHGMAEAARVLVDKPLTAESAARAAKSFALQLSTAGETGPLTLNSIRKAWEGKKTPTHDEALMIGYMIDGGFRFKNPVEYRSNAVKNLIHAGQDKRLLAFGIHALPSALRAISVPIMDVAVPAMKLQAYVDGVKKLLIEKPELIDDDKARITAFSRLRRNIDERFGEMAYDTLFWNRRLLEVFQGAFLSFTWNYGFWKQFGGGAIDMARLAEKALPKGKARRYVGSRANYALFYTALTMFLGGLMTYLFTGQQPETVKDLIYPIVGYDDDGQPERVNTMYFTREFGAMYYHYQSDGVKGLLHLAEYKMSPTFSILAEQLENRNFYDQQIYDPFAPIPTRLKQRATALFESLAPISLGSPAASGETSSKMFTLSLLGFNPAPSYVARPTIVSKIYSLFGEFNGTVKTYQQAQESQARRQLRGLWEAGKKQQFEQLLAKDIERFHWSPRSVKNLYKGFYEPEGAYAFSQLPWKVQVHLREEMTDKQKREYLPYTSKRALKEAAGG